MKTINKIYPLKNSPILHKITLVFMAGLFSLNVFAALDPQPTLTFKGQYDIKMIAAPTLQPVWVKTLNPLEILSPMTDEEMLQCGKYLSLNNEVSGETGDGGNAVKLSAKMHSKTQPFIPAGAIGIATVYADCDDDMSTFQSSAAFLDFGEDMGCTSVEAAYLYWFAPKNPSATTTYAAYPGIPTMRSHAGGTTGELSNVNTVKFKTPGELAYTDVTATRDLSGPDMSVYFADVTSLVSGKGGGLYWVANLKNTCYDDGGGSKGGWNLVVVYRPPNCPPRVIKFWDGFQDNAGGKSINMNFITGEVPKSGNSISYLGFCTIDAEDDAGILADAGIVATTVNSGVQFTSYPAGTTQYINPFITDQPGIDVYSSDGVLHTGMADGMASGRISTYVKETDLNGNEVVRLPATRNTLGFGCNHLKLPANSMVADASNATMIIPSEQNGGLSAYMVYMAIETLQPDLRLYLRSDNSTTAPDGNMTYTLTIENIGPLDSKPNAFVLDTLIKSLDYVGNLQYLDKNGAVITPPTPEVIENQGADVNENMKFYLPVITKGNGTTANDSIRIKFDVKVKPLSRTDIWSYGCNRTIYNRATIVFKSDDNLDLIGGSNSTAGCGGQGSYYDTPIVDATLDAQYVATHTLEDDLTDEVFAKESIGQHLFITTTIQGFLVSQLSTLGLPVSDVSKYDIFNEEGNLVKTTDYFTQDDPTQEYLAVANLGGGCIEEFEYTITVAKVPSFDAATTAESVVKPDFPGDASGSFSVRVFDGTPGYSLTVKDELGTTIFHSNSTSADLDGGTPAGKTFLVDGLAKGTYTYFIGDQGSVPVSGSVSVPDKSQPTLEISGPTEECEGSSVVLTAAKNGGDKDAVFEYVWYKSENNVDWDLLSESSNTLTLNNVSIANTAPYYRAYVCDGAVFATDDHELTVLIQPKIIVADIDSGCYEYNLIDYPVREKNKLTPDDYDLTFHTSRPTSAIDNRFLIPSSKYILKKHQVVWARISIEDKCYDPASVRVYVKSMEECYPIIISDFFSPDYDGFNDRWEVGGLEEYDNPEILVYDRYGKVVFKGGKEDLLEPYGWDGTYLGKPLPSADYWYQMKFKEIEPKVGHFTLKRKKE